MDALSDPASLQTRADVEYTEKPCVEHQHHFDAYEPIQGMVIVGITNDEGEVLLLIHREGPHMTLPYDSVESGEDWVAVATRRVEELTDCAVVIDGVARVRKKHYAPEGDGSRQTVGYDVVMRASSLAGETITEATQVDEAGAWDLRWISSVPDDAAGGAVLDDIQLFFEM
ncbi:MULTISPECIES: NUDIX domain-containing protein [unclassified Haladaptatus]|uniref:NUDIX domain-containing protein n=1 Tax=unclassified Haladaptatus TaxID=2622732 RepID=UPI0023E89D8A|nr:MULTISPECIES: NUDIX domain-containing protein [unclassified Haladaptatus]